MSAGLAAVTGATGFLGVHLVRALSRAGFGIRVLAGREPDLPGWGDVRPQITPGRLNDRAALDQLVAGAQVVIHAAGAIKAANLDGFMSVNRDGARNLAEAMQRAAPQAHLVLVSSLAAREPAISAYAASKRAGEDVCAEVLPPHRLTVLRPPAIYGPGDRETLALFKAASGLLLPVAAPRARIALVHVQDAAEATAAAAIRPTPGVYALADERPQGYGWREILSAAAHAVGGRPRLVDAPAWLLPALARAAGALSRINGRPPLLSPDKARELLHPDWAVSPQELLPGCPAPRFSLEQGFAETVSWYRRVEWLPAPH